MKRWVLFLVAALAVGCGGGGGSSASPAPQPPAATVGTEGLWIGSLHSTAGNVTMPATALVLASGEIQLIDSEWIQAVGSIQPSNSVINGSGTMYVPIGYAFSSGAYTASFSMSGAISGSTFSGTYSGGDVGTFSFTPSPDYAGAVDLGKTAGTYASTGSSTSIPYQMTLTSAGSFSGHDNNGGTFAGTMTAIDAAKNAFRVSMTYTNNEHRDYPVTGVGFFRFSGGTALSIQGVGTYGGFAATFTRTGP